MKADYQKHIICISLILILIWTLSCSGRPGRKSDSVGMTATALTEERSTKLIRIISPEENAGFKLKQPVKVILALEDNNAVPDSVTVYFNGNFLTTIKSNPWEYSIPPAFTITTGRKPLKVTAYKGGKSKNTVTRFLIIYSDIVPKKNGYSVVNTFVHSRDAFTQGLVYEGGMLYEGTGEETGSSLRKVELETGKVYRQLDLDDSLFGEGITIYNNRIYQVTWKNKVGFVYEKSDFKLINKLYYSTEGWGLARINDRIVMSDGTNILYLFDPEMFTVVSKIEVYDNEKKVEHLNELEYINGEIWANIWMTDLIARIDPISGKVIAYIDLTGLLPESDRKADTDVLNGIAFDNAARRIFVTGKRWPKLFEIRIKE